jgi:hypothetical protein
LPPSKPADFFHDIIYGCEIIIQCDHMNITRAETNHTNLRILRQRITLDQEYGAKFEHIAGDRNSGADGLSHLEMSNEIPQSLLTEVYAIDELDRDNNPDFPLSMTLIKSEQDKDSKLQSLLNQERHKSNFGILTFGDHEVHTFNNKVWVPPSLQQRIFEWYHTNLRNPGVTRTLNSIGQTSGWKGMRTHVEAFIKSCDECQRHKIVGKPQYGILPLVPALKAKMPFKKVHVDCAAPLTVRVGSKASHDKIEYQIHVMSMVDAGSGWLELALIPTANSKSCAMQFDKQWLCHYP